MIEPRLNAEDRRIWEVWKRTALMHAKTARHQRRVEDSRRHIDKMIAVAPDAYVAFSGGKDSTALVWLFAEHGLSSRVMSIKDDLDFPGEVKFVSATCERLNFEIDLLHPPFSLQGWLRKHSSKIAADEDMHSRHAEFSKAAFYSVIDVYREQMGTPGVFLGLRKSESHGRLMNRVTRGSVYRTKRHGEWVCQPLCDWSGLDVFGFLFSREAEILDIYRCCRLHESPERIRKSWWLPGKSSRYGGMIWLKMYYPSLYRQLCVILPDASRLA